MDDSLLQRLLYESESDSLDFKSEQYKFTSATDNEKAELLKDILAFVNSWRRVDGYILIGVKDTPQKPNEIVGISQHIDDANLQQFVNKKTNSICLFEYQTYTMNGQTIGIIKIPIQKRPVYLTKDYGKLKKEMVYVRRGSSTDEAKPNEISMMGSTTNNESKRPELKIFFYNADEGNAEGKNIEINNVIFDIPEGIPNYATSYNGMSLALDDDQYYKKYFEYIDFYNAYTDLKFCLENNGNIEAKNVRIEFTIPDSAITILLDGQEIEKPRKQFPITSYHIVPVEKKSNYSIEKCNKKIVIFYNCDLIHAHRTIVLEGSLYLKTVSSSIVNCDISIFCDGIESPFIDNLKIKSNVNKKTCTWKEYKSFLTDKGIEI